MSSINLIRPETFAKHVETLHDKVQQGKMSPVATQLALGDQVKRLDPIATTEPPTTEEQIAQKEQLGGALNKLALLTLHAAEAEPVAASRLLPEAYAHTMDAANQHMYVPKKRAQAVEMLRLVADARKEKPPTTYNEDETHALFASLSAEASTIYAQLADVERAPKKLQAQARKVTRRLLGGLIQESIGHIDKMSRLYEESGAIESEARVGRLFEMEFFTYRLLKWYRQRQLTPTSIRFSVEREDSPVLGGSLKRSFDVVEHSPAGLLRAQAKTSVQNIEEIKAQYDPMIKIVYPGARMSELASPAAANLFRTVIDAEASDEKVEVAWEQLQRYFEPK